MNANLDQLVRLADVHDALARARDPRAFLRAVAGALTPYGPAYIDFAYVHLGSDGDIAAIEVVECWQDGEIVEGSPLVGGRVAIEDFALAEVLFRLLDAPQFIVDIAAEPVLDQVMRGVGRGLASAVLLPLHSTRQGTWQGVLGLYWREHHDPDEVERAAYALLMRLFAEALASERIEAALYAGLHDTEAALHAVEAQRATLKAMLENLPLGVTVFNAHTGQAELLNGLGASMLGIRGPGEPVAAEFYRPGEATPVPMHELPHLVTLTTGATQTVELEMDRGQDARPLIEVTTALLRYPGDPAPRIIILYQDITEVRGRERERMRVQAALLQAQELALAERSTPLIPIRDDVVILPIIGGIDAARGAQILETLVHLGGSARVRVAIVDVTGVRELDATAGGVLADAARALRLRGVRTILTGIQPAVANTLVALDVDLSGIAVYATVQDAVARVGARAGGAGQG